MCSRGLCRDRQRGVRERGVSGPERETPAFEHERAADVVLAAQVPADHQASAPADRVNHTREVVVTGRALASVRRNKIARRTQAKQRTTSKNS